MERSRCNIISCIVLSLLITGCAQDPVRKKFDSGADAVAPMNWPEPPGRARFSFAGQLLGESNFKAERSEERGVLASAFAWLVGLDEADDMPLSLSRPQAGMSRDDVIYVTDIGTSSVFAFDTRQGELHQYMRATGGELFVAPIAIASGADNSLLVSDAELGRVVRLSATGEPMHDIGEVALERPTGIARDADSGLLYVSDTVAHDIKVFDDSGALVQIIGHHGEAPGEFNGPTHLAWHGGLLYVTDTLNARVQVIDTTGEAVRIIGERGLYVGQLTRPKGVTVDGEGYVYVVESYFDHLLVYDSEGRFLLPVTGEGKAIGKFFLPAGAWTDEQGQIYLADMYNGRVVILRPAGS